MSNTTGTVESISTRDFNGKTMYNLKVSGEMYGFGSNKPNCKEGDFISFEYEQKGAYRNGNSKTVKVTSAGTGAASTGSTGYVGGKTTATQTTISKQAALNSAIAFVNGLVAVEAVPGITKTMKAEERYGLMEALVYTKTKEFYKQSTGEDFPEDVDARAEDLVTKGTGTNGGWQ